MMVATRRRHSLPHPASSPPNAELSPSSPENDRKVQAALRKLQIDGTSALVGESPSLKPRDEQTYHYKGTTYAVSAGTKREWIESQPERYKKRQKRETRNRRHTHHGALSNTRSRKVVQTDGADDVARRQMLPLRKRKRGDSDEGETNTAEQEEPEHQATRTKRPRRAHSSNTVNQPSIPAQQKRQPRGVAKRRAPHPITAGALHENKSEDEMESSEDEEIVTRMVEDQTAPLLQPRNTRSQRRPTTSHSLPPRTRVPRKSVTTATSIQQVQSTSDGRVVLNSLIKLAKLNTEVDQLRAAYFKNKEQLERALRKGEQAPNTRSSADGDEHGFSSPAASQSGSLHHSDHERSTSPGIARTRAARSPASLKPTRDLAVSQAEFAMDGVSKPADERPLSIRHDSATSNALTPPYPSREIAPTTSSPFLAKDDSTCANTNDMQHYTIAPPSSRPGAMSPPLDVHWSQRASTPEPHRDHFQRTPRWSLSSQLGNAERAEAHINRDRIDGESKTARRSRVRREMQLVRGWEVEDSSLHHHEVL